MGDVNVLLQACTLEDLSKRVEAYHSLTEHLSSLPQGSDWGNEINGELAKQIISNVKEDLFNEKKDVSYEVTGFLGCFLANEKLMDLLTGEEEQEIFDSLIKLLVETKDRSVLTRGLWSLAQSKFECETYNKNLPKLLSVITDILKCDPTGIIIYETLQVMKSLMESVPKEVLEKVEDWFHHIFPYLFHVAQKIRGVAYSLINFCQLYNQEKIPCLHKYIIPFIPKLKTQYCKQMKQFVEENCSYVLKIWRLLVLILGRNLHSGTTLINGFLEVVEKAFKSQKPEFRVDAFKCWYVLIGNFSGDIEVLTQSKRLKLLIAPLKSNNAKTEDIAYIKLHTWWFLICKGEDRISSNFDLIVIPLLKFCFNSNRISQSGVSERTLLMSGTPPPCTKYTTLLLKACEVLARILSQGQIEASCESFSLSDLTHPIINETLFAKNSQLIFGCVADALMTLDYGDENHRKLGCIILQATIKLVVTVAEANPSKKESVELVKDLFSMYDFIESQSKPGYSSDSFAYDFLKMVIIGEFTFSHHVLHSSHYYIPVGTKLRDMMNGTLSNFYAHKLTTHGMIDKAFTDTSCYCNLWETVLQKSKPASKLIFLEAVIEQLRCAIPSFQHQSADVIITLWMTVAKALDNHIKETQQINQGDNSEHDWTCVYNTLLFPLSCPDENISTISSTIYEDLMGTWSTLWNRFTSLTPLTATAEPNCESDFIARKILSILDEKFSGDGTTLPDGAGFTLAFVADILHIIVDKFRFKEIGRKPKKMLQSPLKQRRKSHPLHNLSSVVDLINLLMGKTLCLVSHWRQKAMQKLCLSYTKLFTTLSHDRFVWLVVSGVTEVMKKALQINPIAKFSVDVEQKFMAMWNAYCGLIECRIVPKLTQDQLTLLSPLISVALQSSHLGLRQRTRLMWSTSFASTSHSIPKDLFDVLKVVALPPASISEMPASESQSLSPKENIPTHISGSFLNREKNQEFSPFATAQQHLKEKLSPSLNSKSPLFGNKTPKGKGANKPVKVNLDELKPEDFVAISSPKPIKRVLTPHQAEKMRERRSDIPALYNDLSQSASQLPSQFISQESIIDISPADCTVSPSHKRSNLTFKGKVCTSSPESSPAKENDDSKNRSYSDEDLAEVLRNASLEMERSFSDSVMILDNSSVDPHDQDIKKSTSKKAKTSLTYVTSSADASEKKNVPSRHSLPEKDNCHSAKRKSATPSKKSLDDVRKSLKGITPKRSLTSTRQVGKLSKNSSHPATRGSSRDKDQATPSKMSPRSESKSSNDSSPLASPLMSPIKPPSQSHFLPTSSKKTKSPVCSPKKPSDKGGPDSTSCNNNADSEDEIPNSQAEVSKVSSLLLFPFASPHELTKTITSSKTDPGDSILNDRPRRNKRKTIFEDESIYVTPLKRTKGCSSPMKEKVPQKESPVVVEKKDSTPAKLSPTKNNRLQSDNDAGKEDEERDLCENNERSTSPKRDLSDALTDATNQKSDSTITLSLNKPVTVTPSKVTRSGRRIVAPNKDMPEPMTPPGMGLRRMSSTEEREIKNNSKDMALNTSKPRSGKTSVATRSGSKIQEKLSLSSEEKSKDSSQEQKGCAEVLAEILVDDHKSAENGEAEEIDSTGSEGSASSNNSVKPAKSTSSNNPLESKEEAKEDDQSTTTKEVRGRLTKKSTPLIKTRHSRRISSRRKGNSEEDSTEKDVTPTEKDAPATSPKKDQPKETTPSETSSPSQTDVEKKSTMSDVILIKDTGQTPDKDKNETVDSTLRECKNSSVIIKTKVSSDFSPTSSVSSSPTSAIFVSSSGESKMNGVSSGWSNMSKYKVIFSPQFVKSSKEEKEGTKGSSPLEEMHIANGGIIFTKSNSEKNLSENLTESDANRPLKKSKSLERFSPSKGNSTANLSPLPLFQVNFKKVGNISSECDKTKMISLSQPHQGDSPNGSVTKVSVKDFHDFHIDSESNRDTKEKESFQSDAAKEQPLYSLRVSPSPKKQISSPSKQLGSSFPEKIILKGSSTPPSDKQNYTLRELQSLSPKSTSSDKNDSSSPKFHLLLNKPMIPLLEGTASSSPPKTASSTVSPKLLDIISSSSPQDSSESTPPRTRLFISPTQKNQKIFLVSSPKNLTNSSPVQKIIYSPHAVNINSMANENETKNHVLLLSNKIISPTEESQPKIASPSPSSNEPPSEKVSAVSSSPVKFILNLPDKVTTPKSTEETTQEKEEPMETSPVVSEHSTTLNENDKEIKEVDGKEKEITVNDKKEGDSETLTKEDKQQERPVSKEIPKTNETSQTLSENVSVSGTVDEEPKEKPLDEVNAKSSARKGKLLRNASAKMYKKGHKLSRRKMKFAQYGKKKPRDDVSNKAVEVDLFDTEEKGKKEVLTRVATVASTATNSEEPVGAKAAQERDSPDKDGSRLTTCVSTPERKKLSVRRVQVPGSRAAIMVACAKRTMRTRIDEGAEGPTTILLGEGKSDVSSNAGQFSPAITPSRKRSLFDGYLEGKPWAKHEPSPGASPCGSILKKRPADDDALPTISTGEISDLATDGSPSSVKCRRVSFADPPVSESVEIPPSPKVQKNHKAQKRLDMTQALNSEAKEFLLDCDISQESYKTSLDTPNCSQPLYSSLLSSSDSIDILAPFLTSPSLAESLKVVFRERGIKTIGDFCALTAMDVESLPIYPPKTSNAIQCLKNYEEKLSKEPEGDSPSVDAQPSAETLPLLGSEKKSVSEETSVQSPDIPMTSPSQTTLVSSKSLEKTNISYGTDIDPEEEQTSTGKETTLAVNDVTKNTTPTGDALTISPPNNKIKECEFPRVFCQQIERDSDAIPSFIEGLSLETRLKMFKGLTDVIPYKNVIETFHRYLLSRETPNSS